MVDIVIYVEIFCVFIIHLLVKAIAVAVLAKLLALHEDLKKSTLGDSIQPSSGVASIRDSSVETESLVNVEDNAVEELQSFCGMQEKYSSVLHESKLRHVCIPMHISIISIFQSSYSHITLDITTPVYAWRHV